MNTKNLKAYAPKARRQFMEAVAKRAAHFGIYEDEIAPVSFQGSTAIIEGNAFTKQQGEQRKRLEKRVEEKGYDLFVREMAYTWFNRLAALRYMELQDYFEHGCRVLSNSTNQDGLPEILDHAADVADMLGLDKAQIIEWQLAGDKQEVLYRELLLGQCHHLHSVMPFLFEAIDDATELLLPDNLTKTDSILKGLINDIPEEDWEQIEVIGWLYQFYISEHKDAVIGKVVKSEDIPAATQLFTPNWIVKYLVQNSIGRQWLATYPDSSIKAKMEYYIEPAEQTDEVNAQLAAITPRSLDPETIKVLDPACGSGHILVEMYELLREIYLERGYRLREIPELILTKNIYGLDIDDRAAQLAGFALLMKAREDDRRIFQRVQDGSVKLNVYALQSTEGWDSASLWHALNLDGKAKQGSSGDLFVETKKFDAPTGEYAEYFDLLKHLIMSFEQAKTVGSLIQVEHQYLPTLRKLKEQLLNKVRGTDPVASGGAEKLIPIVDQATLLAQRYDAVVANPPYMGGKGMNAELKEFAKTHFANSKADLFAMFMDRGMNWLKKTAYNAMVTMQAWMFLSSYEKMREKFLCDYTIDSLLHMGNGVMKIAFGTSATIFRHQNLTSYVGRFSYCENKDLNDNGVPNEFPIKNKRLTTSSANDFIKIPGKPISYWVSDELKDSFQNDPLMAEIAKPRQGLATSDDNRFLRLWFEVDAGKFAIDGQECKQNNYKWVPFQKGGGYRRWYGNNEHVINWENKGKEVLEYAASLYGSPTRTIKNIKHYFSEGIAWSIISSGKPSFRYFPKGQIFGHVGPAIFFDDLNQRDKLIAILNSSVCKSVLGVVSETFKFEVGHIAKIPVKDIPIDNHAVNLLIDIHKRDWDSLESSWDFSTPPLLTRVVDSKIFSSVNNLQMEFESNLKLTLELENKIDQEISRAYGCLDQNPLTVTDLTLHRNYVREGLFDKQRMTANLIVELVSYSIGCMMGRYSLNKGGIVYAHAGNEGFKELVAEGAYKSFPVDDDGIIPLASEEWLFEDDATTRFREFVRSVWGAEHLQENLEFVAESLCLNAIRPKKGESAMETIRRYFSTQFFADHCKMYKKRPIYWLFSSGKEKAIECLVYLHRYNEATLSRMRTEYVTPLMGKYDHQLSRKMEEVVEATGTEQRRIEKEIKDLEKKQAELRKYDEELKHYAEMRISLDLDDGVKANYGRFGNLLANVKGIHGKAVN
ncbi:BREX-1 system adenine-specific DNA-methyltransferase PglX [Alteromonas gilva]|uniref:site-specific DNA-methyltransferase (adenine-specific) n=1 Tax=Alteromonas gilva TaxID=2987522 RepID=A0ABT5KZN3_9ALTE|nr:BREX-1 system adenine-specific DNA-methyltransferase PglX [Alteromonas gilva]MDC8829721.1 BREX-1 system adenine-specific DNA-methyltransferase PglX [Alteromonas gilva]